MFHGDRLVALFALAFVSACAIGLGWAVVRDGWPRR